MKTSQEIIDAAAKVRSLAQLLKLLNLRIAGGNYANMKKKLQELNVDCSHWTGQAWSKGERQKDWSQYKKASHCKEHLIKERGHNCDICKLSSWLNGPIPIEVHHIDGDRTNNSETNLQLVCPNCHALTSNYRGKNKIPVIHKKVNRKTNTCIDCNIKVHTNSNRCYKCYFTKRNIESIRPTLEQLLIDREEFKNNMTAIGRKYGVTDNCVRKWIKRYNQA